MGSGRGKSKRAHGAHARGREEVDRAVYLMVFDCFSADTREVADEHFDGRLADANASLKRLAKAGLVGSMDLNNSSQGSGRRGQYKSLEWQCYETYDWLSREEAEALFEEKYSR